MCQNCPRRPDATPAGALSEIKSSDGSTWYQPKTLDELKSVVEKVRPLIITTCTRTCIS